MTTSPAPQKKREAAAKMFANLPPLPAVALKVLQSVARNDVSMRELSELIGSDPAFSGEILTIVNSPLCGFRKEVNGILMASTLLGIERLKGVAVTAGMRSYTRSWDNVPALRACWRHSLACALLADELGKALFIEPDFAYTAGILHDLGRVALIAVQPAEYSAFLKSIAEEPCDVEQRERELFGVDHCEAGKILVESWRLPANFLAITSKHHDVLLPGKRDILYALQLACGMADAIGFSATLRSNSLNYEELTSQLLPKERERFQFEQEELALRIAIKINAVEN